MTKVTDEQKRLMTAANKYRRMRANGGHLKHLVQQGAHEALCGFEPSSPNGYKVRNRGYWAGVATQPVTTLEALENICPKCLKKA